MVPYSSRGRVSRERTGVDEPGPRRFTLGDRHAEGWQSTLDELVHRVGASAGGHVGSGCVSCRGKRFCSSETASARVGWRLAGRSDSWTVARLSGCPIQCAGGNRGSQPRALASRIAYAIRRYARTGYLFDPDNPSSARCRCRSGRKRPQIPESDLARGAESH
jgi:hypothetical protein